jgi:hypothetical protein
MSPKNLVHDFFVTLAPSDSARLSVARQHQHRLEEFPAWDPPVDPHFLMQMGENLFHLAFPTEDAVRKFVNEFVIAVTDDTVLRLWLYAEDPQVTMLPWEYLCLTQGGEQVPQTRCGH